MSAHDIAAPEADPAWGRFLATLVAALVAAAALLAFALVALDPYDTGRFALVRSQGVGAGEGPRTANASRGRDPAFDAAVIGNSHVQLLQPEHLSARTGDAWVSLIAPATGPKEQLVLLDWFLRHRHAPAKALVIGLDVNWCVNDPTMPNEKPFPFWLYERSGWRYVAGLFRSSAVTDLAGRIERLFGKGKRARADGWWDYEPEYRRLGYDGAEKRAALEKVEDTYGSIAAGPFPAAEKLGAALAAAPGVPVILLRPPIYRSVRPNTEATRAAQRACDAAFAAVAAARPKTRFVDWQAGPGADDPANFFDRTHYRRPLAERIEAVIASSLAELR